MADPYRPQTAPEILSRNRMLAQDLDLLPQEFKDWLIRYLEQRNPVIQLGSVNKGGSFGYTTTNVTTDRTYDANATTTDELADVLGTLIADLKTQGII